MDVALQYCDDHFFTPYVYPESWAEDGPLRQFISLNIVVTLGGILLYLGTAALGWVTTFDKTHLQHPLILENQVRKEILYALWAIPYMGFATCILFVLEIRGYGYLYDKVDESSYGWWSIPYTTFTFIAFTDFVIYWIHRWMHHPYIYKWTHKPHHKWVVPTPFASHAFHPIDGFLQSVPYHIYVFLFPMQKFHYLIMYMIVNVWTVSIHDGYYLVPGFLKPFINGSAHHMDHHIYYNYNYGQYFTLWDRIGGSFRTPTAYEGKGPLDEIARLKREGKLKSTKQS